MAVKRVAKCATYISSILLILVHGIFAEPYRLDWSSNAYGPDGPWHAVTVALGNPPQKVDLFPATWYSTWPLTSTVCSGYEQGNCKARKGGFYDPGRSSTFKKLSSKYTSGLNSQFAKNAFVGFGEVFPTNGSLVTGNDTLHFLPSSTELSVPQSGIDYIEQADFRAPGGATYPVTLGYLSLGAGLATASDDPNAPWDYFNVAYSWLYLNKIIDSPSWTLHIGSSSLGIEPSMYLGGYDENRIAGDVLSQVLEGDYDSYNNLAVNIADIAIGTIHGPSPFVKGDQKTLLSAGGASTSEINIEPAVPYLFLPTQTCTNIADHLPVTYSPDYGLYLWNTHDPRFRQIMASPSYLSFSLRAASHSEGPKMVEIKIPFQLLNLTLSEPITATDIQYFPCAPVADNGKVALGRAFLQAALIGVNWYLPQPKSWWFLAQAPGPALKSPSVRAIQPRDHGLFSSSLDWESSWSDFWDSVADLAPPPQHASSSVLSTGAQVGIGVGVALGIFLIAGLIILFWWRRRQRSDKSAHTFGTEYTSPTGTYVAEPHSRTSSQHVDKDTATKRYMHLIHRQKAELEQPKAVHELPGYNMERFELPQ